MYKIFYVGIISFLVFILPHSRKNISSLDSSERLRDTSTINTGKIIVVDPLKLTESISFKLSDLVEELSIVKLETTDASLIDNVMRYYVGEKYIIITTVSNGILLFSREGKFLTQIAKRGRGPGEIINPNGDVGVDEKNDFLFLAGNTLTPPHSIFRYNLKSGGYTKIPVQSNVSVRDLIITNDSILILSLMPNIGTLSDCPIICQTISGKIFWKIVDINKYGATNGKIRSLYDQLYFYYMWGGDTLYQLMDRKLIPIIALSHSGRMFLNLPYKEGDAFFNISPFGNNLFKGSYYKVNEIKNSEANRQLPVFSDKINFIVDLKKRKVLKIEKLYDNFLGSSKMLEFDIQNNGTIVSIFSAVKIKQLAKKVKEDPEIDYEVKTRIQKLNLEITEFDNPILLIGKLKK